MLSVVVGLGNPGVEYDGTRHNVGFDVLDSLAGRRGAHWRLEKKWNAMAAQTNTGWAEGPGLRAWLIKPATYMNLSGDAVRSFLDWHHQGIDSILVVLDDVSLPLGQIRIRPGGGSGGHRGLASVIERLGTNQVARMRCGVGAQMPGRELSEHVLDKFRLDELPQLERMMDRAVGAIECAFGNGLPTAMNEFNGDQKDKQQQRE